MAMQCSGFYCPDHDVRFRASEERGGVLPCGCPARLYTYRKFCSGGKDGNPSTWFSARVYVFAHDEHLGELVGIDFCVFQSFGRTGADIKAEIEGKDWPEWKRRLLLKAFDKSGGTGCTAWQWERMREGL